jgi:hypothetical protein
MKLMFCDETNLEPSVHTEFFVYGGLIVDADEIGPLSQEIDEIRGKRGFAWDDALKFRTGSRPTGMTIESWTQAKAETIAVCVKHGVTLVACLIHHQIAAARKEHLTDWQLNTILDVFNQRYLSDCDDFGMVIIDRIGRQQEYQLLREKFVAGGETPWGTPRLFSRIVAYAATCDGASHMASAADVVLGSLAFCVNHRHTESEVCREIFESLDSLIWRRQVGPRMEMFGSGIVLNPAQIKAAKYQQEYDALKSYLRRLSRSA